MFLGPDQEACFHFLIKVRWTNQNEQPEGKWGERKRVSGSQGYCDYVFNCDGERTETKQKHRQRRWDGHQVRRLDCDCKQRVTEWWVSVSLRRARRVRGWKDDYGGWEGSMRRKLGKRSWRVRGERAHEVNDGGQLLPGSQMRLCFWNDSSQQKSTAKETNGKVKVMDLTCI